MGWPDCHSAGTTREKSRRTPWNAVRPVPPDHPQAVSPPCALPGFQRTASAPRTISSLGRSPSRPRRGWVSWASGPSPILSI